MKALLIEWDGPTGIRAGNINARDPKLQCHGWQILDTAPCKEIRVILDERDVSRYEGVDGVTVLHNDKEIEAAIAALPVRYSVTDETLMRIDIEQRNIILADIPGDAKDVYKALKQQGVKGVVERKRRTLVDAFGPKGKRKAKGLPE